MSRAELVAALLAAPITGLLLWAAICDVRHRRIPNLAVAGVLLLALPWALASGVPLASALLAGLLALAIGFVLFALGIVGAGDAKLFASLALCAGLTNMATLGLATACAGGVVAVVSLVTRPRRALVLLQMRGAAPADKGVPYGVAIALGGALVLWAHHLIAATPWPVLARLASA